MTTWTKQAPSASTTWTEQYAMSFGWFINGWFQYPWIYGEGWTPWLTGADAETDWSDHLEHITHGWYVSGWFDYAWFLGVDFTFWTPSASVDTEWTRS